MPNINVPGVGVVAFPDDMSHDQIGVAIRQDILPGIQKSGFGAGIKSGIEGLKGAYQGIKYGITESPEDLAALQASQAKQEALYQGPGYEDVKEAFKERGALAGLGRTWEAAKGTLGQSIPYMAAPVAAAALAPEAAIAGVGLGTLGFLGTSAAQYTGQNIGRQVQEGQDVSLARAAAASAPAALLDRFALGQTFKGTGLGKLFGQEGKEAVEQVANKVLKSGGNPSKIGAILAGGGRGIAAEIPNEVGQQILERAQAGLSLTDDDAMREYKEAAFGATLLGGPFGGVSGAAIRGKGVRQAGETVEGARAEMGKELQQRAIAQAALESRNLAQQQPQLPGMEMPAVTPYIQPEPPVVEQPTPEFQLGEQQLPPTQQDFGFEVPTAQPAAPQLVDNTYLKSAGLGSVLSLKKEGKNSIHGLDLNRPEEAAAARAKLLHVAETTKSGKFATAIENLLQSDSRLQEQPELGGFPTQQEMDVAQVEKNAADAELARQQRNAQLGSLLSELEAENVAKETAAREAADAEQRARQEALAKGVTEDITQVPFTGQLAPAQAPTIEEAPSPSVPSEVRPEDTAGGLEPSVGVDGEPSGVGAGTDTGPSGEPLRAVGEPVERPVEAPETSGGALTQGDINRITAGLRKEGLTREEARQQVAEATPDELTAMQRLYAPVQAATTTTAEQEADIAEAAQTEGEFGDISARNVQEKAPVEGVPLEEAKQQVAQILRGWNRDVNVQVVNRNNLPEGFQQTLLDQNLLGAKGFIDKNGTVFVIANNNKDAADIAATMFHESLGHLGLRLKFKEELGAMMNKFYNTNAEIKRAANQWLKDHKGEYSEDLSQQAKQAKAVEEVLAERSEAGRLPAGLMDKLKAFINKWARRMGINRAFSDAEIRSILDQAQQEVTEKTGESKTESKEELTPRSAAADRLAKMNREVKQVEESAPFVQTKIDQVKQIAKAPAKWRDLIETMVFSADARINNAIRRGLLDKLEMGGQEAADAMAKLYSISTSQALHNEAVAHQFIEQGNVKYNPELFKYEAVKDDNSWANMVQELKKIADQYGFTFPEMEAYAQAAIEARRLKGINEFNTKIEKEADALAAKGKKKLAETHREKMKRSHLTDEQIETGEGFFKDIPELNKVVDMWNGIRKNAMKVAVDAGLYSEEDAEAMLEKTDYVPFYRVEQLESKAGPKEFSRGLLDAAREYKFKGSEQEVNNIFDNMERWTSYIIRRAVNNKSAQNLVQVSQEVLDEAKEVPKAQRGMEANTVAIWQDGERKLYEFSDPFFVKAFTGLEPVALPAFKALSTFSNALRKNIVLNPLFSISQLSQDSMAAMLTSGLKHPFKLPIEVVKEFVKTLRGTSAAHETLKAFGAVGVRDYSATISRLDAEMAAGLKDPSTWQKLLSPLEKFSMASDNAVRQAIYNMTMQETNGDKAKAVERAFEIINFRRKGASGTLAIAGQVIPFFNAYLQAQNVAYKVLTGRGVSPTARSEAKKVFVGNAVKIAALSFMYAAVMSDDDDYKKMDPTIRDRHWIIPGTGLMLPTRTDLFSMPKIIAEHTYALMTDQGFEDGTKARRAMSDALVNAITGPTPVPQAFKPLIEVVLNRNFYQGRPIIGRGIENLKTSEQYTASTSELAKAIGSTGLIAPVNVDHLIRGYLGTTGGLTMMAMDAAINSAGDVPKPAKSTQDILASTPGLSTFVSKEFGNAAKTDFYELKGMVDEVGATLNRFTKTGRMEDAKGYLGEEQTQNLLKVKSQVNQIQSALSKLRERENLIREMPNTRMNADQKEVAIRQIREQEQRMLGNVEKLRKLAGL